MSKIIIVEDSAWVMPKIFAFQINGTQITPASPVVSTPWLTGDAAYQACFTYIKQVNAWWRKTHPGEDYCDESCILPDTLHLDINSNVIRYGFAPSTLTPTPPLPVGLTGYYTEDFNDGSNWMPFPGF